MRILHLEDSIADHRLTALQLQRSGFDAVLHHVDTLSDLRHLLEQEKFDAVLADYQLAGFTAMDAWKIVGALNDPPPFILLSGAIGEPSAVAAIQQGVADYVLKNQITRLAHVLKRAVDSHEAKRQRDTTLKALAHSEKRLALLTAHLQESVEQERAAIAREIHDDIGGALTAIRFDLSWIGRHTNQPGVADHAGAATAMLQLALTASQRIMKNLRPPVLDQGLTAAVSWMARDFEARTAVKVQIHSTVLQKTLNSQIEMVAFRTTQEALTNISKHASASSVSIDISHAGGMLTLEVSDDGCGMCAEDREKANSFGIAGLQERAKTVGGWIDISQRQERGTSVILSVPLDQQNVVEEEL